MAMLFISPDSTAGKVGKMNKGLYIQTSTTVWLATVTEFLLPLNGYVMKKLRCLGYH